jgi:hypothetical protein
VYRCMIFTSNKCGVQVHDFFMSNKCVKMHDFHE